MTAPFDRWRASCQPGLLPSRDTLDALDDDRIVGIRADVLRQLVVQAARHDAPCGHLAASVADETHHICVSGRADREIKDAESLSVEARTLRTDTPRGALQ